MHQTCLYNKKEQQKSDLHLVAFSKKQYKCTAPKQISATRDTRDTQQHDEFNSSHRRQQRSHMPSTYPAQPSPLWRHPRLPTRRLARALAPHRTPAHNTRTQREHRNYASGQGGQGAQSTHKHAGCTGARECEGVMAVHGHMAGQCLTWAHTAPP